VGYAGVGDHQTAYINEMVRVLKPGGKLAVATWCQRESTGGAPPLTKEDQENLQFLYDEWAHPMFIPYEEYARIMERTGLMQDVSVRTPFSLCSPSSTPPSRSEERWLPERA
jgi:ubiquinone/menaquinone biosynthesis C-methylase UbiE